MQHPKGFMTPVRGAEHTPRQTGAETRPVDRCARRPVPPEATAFLNHLRLTFMACRTKPRADLFEACALLHVNRCRSLDAHAEALMRCLGAALGQAPRLHSPGSAELTFDEAWLVELAQASARADTDSLTFLLRSRVMPEHRRLIGFLIANTARCFDLNGTTEPDLSPRARPARG